MKVNKWTLGLAAVGLVTIPVTMQAEEKMSALQTALSSTTIGGYVDTSAQWQIGKAKGATPPGYAFNTPSKQDGFNLNVVNLTIQKPLDAQDNWAAGYMIDMIYGPNAAGWNTSVQSYSGSSVSTSDFGLKQAYVALRAPVGNGIDFKIGTFDTIIGYEVYHSGNNPNYTRSYGYTMESTQHTGVMGTYQFCKEFGIALGIANTHNSGINNRAWLGDATRSETYKTYMGAATLTAPDSWGFLAGSTLYVGAINGFNTAAVGTATGDNQTAFYAGATVNTPVKGLKAGVSYDYLGGHNTGGKGNKFWADAASLYLSYQATEKLSLHGRAEYFWYQQNGSGGIAAGLPDKILALTGTVQYDLWANVLSRLEFRWDHQANGTGRLFNDADRDAFLLAANIIYKF
ncbi:MAG: outer membrane beta-barrel protein [Verrucomicrobia bacterium]|nr:outer membrane beta-barrel protein [Verrucomicrobiota bacterium]